MKEIYCAECYNFIGKKQMVIEGEKGRLCIDCYKKSKRPSNFITFDELGMDLGQSSAEIVKKLEENTKMVNEVLKAKTSINEPKINLTPKEIVEKLDRTVIGQERAKKILATAFYNHCQRVESEEKEYIPKANVIIKGPTGCGKTFIMKQIAKMLDVPFYVADASRITESGISGADVESVLTGLYYAAGRNIKKMEKGIIFLDEFDKLGKYFTITAGGSSIGEGVQRQFLKLIEGCETDFPINGAKLSGETERVNTENILFVCGGTFEEMDEKKQEKASIGFGAKVEKEVEEGTTVHYTVDDFISYGIISEIMGRFPIITILNQLSEKDLEHIITSSETSVVKGYKKIFQQRGIKLQFTNGAIKEIARMAYKKGTGARGINSIVEMYMMDIMYEVFSERKVSKVKITKEMMEEFDLTY